MSASLWELPSVLRARRPCAVRARQCRIVITIATPARGTFTTRIGTSRRLARFRVLRCTPTARLLPATATLSRARQPRAAE